MQICCFTKLRLCPCAQFMDEFKVSHLLWFHCLALNWKFLQHSYVAKSIALFFGSALIRMDLGNNGNFKRVHFCAQMDPVSNTMRGRRGCEWAFYLNAILTGRFVSVLVWLGLGGEGREESLGRRLPPQTQLFLFVRGSKFLRGRGYTPHGQINS